jgi:hypothetical protein
MAKAFSVKGFPTFALLDSDGTVLVNGHTVQTERLPIVASV